MENNSTALTGFQNKTCSSKKGKTKIIDLVKFT